MANSLAKRLTFRIMAVVVAIVPDHRQRRVVIDCTELNYISSSGLRILLNIFKHTRTCGHASILKGLNPEVKEVFQLSGFLQLFKVEN